MPILRDLDVVHRLNAPTRAAATRRRRLRKLGACVCLAAAALVATGGGTHDVPASSSPSSGASTTDNSERPELRGRQFVTIDADAALADRLTRTSRVDVWAPDGTRLTSAAPVVPPFETKSRSADVSNRVDRAPVLVALTPPDVMKIARHTNDGHSSWSDLFVTVSP